MSFKNLNDVLKEENDDLQQILEDIGIEETYLENALTQNVTSTEYASPKDEYFKIPTGTKNIKYSAIKPSKKKKPLIFLATTIMLFNKLSDLDTWPEIKYFTWAIILVAITSGCLKTDKHFLEEEAKESENYYKNNAEDLKNVLKYIPNAKNFIALSIINFIRFNHHYPKEKLNLIKKGFLGIPENTVEDFLNSNGKNLQLFYSYPFQACKLVNEHAFFYKYINKTLKPTGNDESDCACLAYDYIQDYSTTDSIIILRNEPTTNCFLILDLLFVMVNWFNSHNLLGFFPDRNLIKDLIEKRKFLKEHPFQYHPARFYLKIKYDKEEYNNFVTSFNENIKKIGNLIFQFCTEEGGTLQEAKSIQKFQYSDIGNYNDLLEIYKLVKEEKKLFQYRS